MLFFAIFGICMLIFVLTLVIMLSPAASVWFMSRRIKAGKKMLESSKGDILDIAVRPGRSE